MYILLIFFVFIISHSPLYSMDEKGVLWVEDDNWGEGSTWTEPESPANESDSQSDPEDLNLQQFQRYQSRGRLNDMQGLHRHELYDGHYEEGVFERHVDEYFPGNNQNEKSREGEKAKEIES